VVAKGFNQRPGFDYTEIFAPTMCLATICLVLALAATEDLHHQSVDISHAFINSDINTKIYMTQPEGFRQGGQEMVCRLNKSLYSLYGCKQAGHLWSKQFQDALEKMGFRCIHSDPSIYIYDQDGIKVSRKIGYTLQA
jgi:hypothetical protein